MVIIVHEIDIATLGNNLVEGQRRLSYLQWSDKVQSWVGPLPKQEETVKVYAVKQVVPCLSLLGSCCVNEFIYRPTKLV